MRQEIKNVALAGTLAASGVAMEASIAFGQDHDHSEPSPVPSLMPEMNHAEPGPMTSLMPEMDHEVEHTHGEAAVDPDAPVYRVEATEFSYNPEHLMVENEVFTINMHNKGVTEHDFTIENFEDQGGIHLASEEMGLASFTLEDGEYVYYCTIPGHRAAGMEGVLMVNDVDDDHEDDHSENDH